MKINTYYSEMHSIKNKINKLPNIKKINPSRKNALKDFFGNIKYAIKLLFLEKEIITFALLQWICVILGYYLSIQIIGWVPDKIWEMVATKSSESYPGATVVKIVFSLWIFLCISITAYPIGILTSCMGVSHFLHKQGKKSTIIKCLNIVMPSALSIWILHWIDGYWTVGRILDRIPSKNKKRIYQIKLDESLYYAWKIGLTAILPVLITGTKLIDIGKRSISVVKHKAKDIIIIRMGYSFLCWIVATLTYIGTIFFLRLFPNLFETEQGLANEILSFYNWIGIPILFSVAIIMLFLRPIYIISACNIYSDFILEKEEELTLPKTLSK